MARLAYGHNAVLELSVVGPVFIDGYILARKMSEKLQSYSLKYVAEHWANAGVKHDVTYSDMVEAFTHCDPELLRRVGDYCVQDAALVHGILTRMDQPQRIMAMARLTGVTGRGVASRGTSYLSSWQVYHEAIHEWNMVKDTSTERQSSDESYQGAIVKTPKIGLYTHPVVVLDFASLYPSIMCSYNISFDTLCGTDDTPDGHVIRDGDKIVGVYRHGRGVIPSVVWRLMELRNEYRVKMKQSAPDSLEYKIAKDGSMAAKIAANSLYGWLGSVQAPHPGKLLAASITAGGRMALEKTCDIITTLLAEGRLPPRTEVVYGDTDSVMVSLPGTQCAEAESIGKMISEVVTASFSPPMKLQVSAKTPYHGSCLTSTRLLQFETCFKEYLLFNKKRYIGVCEDASMVIKGICLKRRDFPPVVQKCYRSVVDNFLGSSINPHQAALDALESTLESLCNHSIPIDDVVIVKELNKEYKGTKPPHAVVASKMYERDPSTAPSHGARVRYVVIEGSLTASVADRSEDVEYVIQHGLRYDATYYVKMVGDQVMELMDLAGLKADAERMIQRGLSRSAGMRKGQRVLTPLAPLSRGQKRGADDRHITEQRRRQTKVSDFFTKSN